MRRSTVFLALWVGIALAAVGTGTWAMAAAGDRLDRDRVEPLSQDQVRAELSSDGSTDDPSSSPSGSDSPSASPSNRPPTGMGEPRGHTTAGGGVVVSCKGDQAFLVSWSPAPGYRADDPVRGPAPVVGLEFESDESDDVTVAVRCVNGEPRVTSAVDPDDHGGDDGRHGGNDSSPSASSTDDNSGPGSGDSTDDNSGSGSGHDGSDGSGEDNSGPGSSDSGGHG